MVARMFVLLALLIFLLASHRRLRLLHVEPGVGARGSRKPGGHGRGALQQRPTRAHRR
ncbi:MAG: hypothetical protein R3A10_09510 [Caldilineaceae bacterium]